MAIEYKTLEYDGIIIGGGGSGLCAAIEAHKRGTKVAVVMKCLLGKAHTVMAEGGMSAVVGPTDSLEKHFADTMIGGYGINDWEKVWELVNEAKNALYFLEDRGAIFNRDVSGRIMPRPFGGHSEKRTCYVSDRTGHAIIHTLKNELLRMDVPFFEKTMITSLLTKDGRVVGATAIDIRTGELILFKTKFVLLATGGCGQLYKYTADSKDITSEGVALAYEAGAELQDMEMIQFHPTCMFEPEEKRGILVTEACRGEGGMLINSKGERFMKSAKKPDGTPKYVGKLGHCELETRDVVARAIEEQYENGLGPVRLVVAKKAWDNSIKELKIPKELQPLVDRDKLLEGQAVKERLATMHEQFEKLAGVDITEEGMIVRPAQHYMMGGVRNDTKTCASTVKGLFAAGEVASGMHGANRLGSNSLTSIQVEGFAAGRGIAEYAKSAEPTEVDRKDVEKEFSRVLNLLGEGGVKQSQVRRELQETMWNHVGIKRDEKNLKTALEKLEQLNSKAKNIKVSGDRIGNIAWQEAIETIYMLTVAESIVRSALERRESRGAHCRTDYPSMESKWLVNVTVKKGKDEKMVTGSVKVKEVPDNLKAAFPKEWLQKVYGR